MAELKGECLCGKIRYEYRGKTGNLVHCHCSKCRKWHGSAFRSRIVIEKSGYRLTQGEKYLVRYQASDRVVKTFCSNCGSSLATIYPTRDSLLGLPIAGCEGEFDVHQEFHIHTASKASWWQIDDNLTQYAEMPDEPGITHCLYE